MEMTGEQCIPASQDAVWAALNDPAILRACIPGCDSIERQSDNEYRISMLAAVGPVKARFHGKLTIRDADPPRGYALSFEGSGGAAGFGRGQARVALAPGDDGTQLAYSANAEVSGKLAQLGSRLMDGVAKKMAAEFFHRFKASFTQDGQVPRPAADGHPAIPAGMAGAPATPAQSAAPGAKSLRAAANDSPASAPVRDILRELRVWQTIAVASIATACLVIGYIIGAH